MYIYIFWKWCVLHKNGPILWFNFCISYYYDIVLDSYDRSIFWMNFFSSYDSNGLDAYWQSQYASDGGMATGAGNSHLDLQIKQQRNQSGSQWVLWISKSASQWHPSCNNTASPKIYICLHRAPSIQMLETMKDISH